MFEQMKMQIFKKHGCKMQITWNGGANQFCTATARRRRFKDVARESQCESIIERRER